MYVYADVVFLINLSMNTAILLLTARLAGISYSWSRIIGAASLGGVFVLASLMPHFYILNGGFAKVLLSLILIFTAFGRKKIKTFVFLTGVFYIVSFIFGGAVFGWFLFWQENGPFHVNQWENLLNDLTWLNLAEGSFIALLLGSVLLRLFFPRLIRSRSLYRVRVEYGGHFCEFIAMLDTGNSLYTVISRKPVVLVNHSVLEGLLGADNACLLSECQSEEWFKEVDRYHNQPWISRIQIIPFKGVGNGDILLGFRPDRLTIYTKGEKIITTEVVLGIYNGILSSDKRYEGLLHPAIMND